MGGDQRTPEQQLAAALRAADAVIGYTRIGDEPDCSDFMRAIGATAEIVRLPAAREQDPHAAASALAAAHAGKRVCVLVPGRAFDRSGTRHGRGGGWYDRFLSVVPRAWLRVGVLNASQLSESPLIRASWDEPMGMLLVREPSGWKVVGIRKE